MNHNKLIQNIIDQIKEAQIKLGYARETVRLYYPLASLNTLLGIAAGDVEELLTSLKREASFSDTPLGALQFTACGERIEISVSPKGAEYVHQKIPTPPFLADIIKLFGRHHSCSLKDICDVFGKYSEHYTCEKMPDGMDFDYALHFDDAAIDPYYYCIKSEMGHTIYHRFTKEDYRALM